MISKERVREIIKEEIDILLTETGEPDQNYDHAIYDAITEEIGSWGFQATHREFDKYQGIYIQIRGVDRFWFEDMIWGEASMKFLLYPETDTGMRFEGSVYEAEGGEWICSLDEELKDYLKEMKSGSGRSAKEERQAKQREQEEADREEAAKRYEKNRPKLHNPNLKGKYLVIETPYGKYFYVDEDGRITQERDQTPSGEWLFLGLVPVNADYILHRFNDLTPELLKEIPFTYKNGNPRYTVIDFDHGSQRVWGNTKVHGVKRMYITEK